MKLTTETLKSIIREVIEESKELNKTQILKSKRIEHTFECGLSRPELEKMCNKYGLKVESYTQAYDFNTAVISGFPKNVWDFLIVLYEDDGDSTKWMFEIGSKIVEESIDAIDPQDKSDIETCLRGQKPVFDLIDFDDNRSNIVYKVLTKLYDLECEFFESEISKELVKKFVVDGWNTEVVGPETREEIYVCDCDPEYCSTEYSFIDNVFTITDNFKTRPDWKSYIADDEGDFIGGYSEQDVNNISSNQAEMFWAESSLTVSVDFNTQTVTYTLVTADEDFIENTIEIIKDDIADSGEDEYSSRGLRRSDFY